jgi:hypothetical protein
MIDMDERIKVFNNQLQASHSLACMARDYGLQVSACSNLSALLETVAEGKTVAVTEGNENLANLFLGFECVAQSLRAELTMWILLKDEKPDEAWNSLIVAQKAAAAAAKAHPGFLHLEHQHARLESIEKLLFPPQVFLSAGWIVGRQECSICAAEYGTCDHLVGKPYMGQLCSIVAKELEGDHVAIVKVPSDKRCRVVTFQVESGTRNRMTWKIEPSKDRNLGVHDVSGDSSSLSQGLTCSVIIAAN